MESERATAGTSSEDFSDFRRRELEPALRHCERRRRRMVAWAFLLAAACAWLLTGLVLGLWFVSDRRVALCLTVGSALLCCLGLLFAALAWTVRWTQLSLTYKRDVVGRIVGFVSPQLTYRLEDFIGSELVARSMLFPSSGCVFAGDDLISGRLGSTYMGFSDLTVSQARGSPSRGENQDAYRDWPVFHGVMFVADFNKDFEGFTLLLPDAAERLVGTWLGSAVQRLNVLQPGRLRKLEDPEFERYFAVYSSDELTARYILTPSLMRRIVDLRRRVARPLAMSFSGSCVYLAWRSSEELFEMSWTRSLLREETTHRIYALVRLLAEVVEDLDLNTRVWTKE